jgi:hypothetical protein
METPQALSKFIPRYRNGKTALGVLLAFGLILAINLALFALLAKANPRALGDAVQGAFYLGALLGFINLSGRVAKLEKARKAADPGPLVNMIADAKAAARLAGYDETQVDAVAKEVLTTCVKASGGWKA